MLSHKEQVGRLDRRITIQRPQYGTDDSNQKLITGWVDVLANPVVYAQVEDKSGGEVFQADQLTGVKVTVFTIRYREDLSILFRIVYRGLTYDIQNIEEVSRKRFLKITATAGGHYAANLGLNSFSDTEYADGYQ